MIFQSPGPILLELGPLTIRWYGLVIALGFVLALHIAQRYIRPQEISEDELTSFAITILISGLIGARLWFVILNYDYFIQHPIEIPQIWLGGQSIQGGLIGAALGSYLLEPNRKSYLSKLATITTVLPLAQAIGRLGNFFNEEAYGSVTDLPWKLYISHTGQYHHPTFLYEALWNIASFVALLSLRRNKASDKKIIAAYLILYSLARIFLEQLRSDSLYIASIPAATLLSLIAIIIALILINKS